MAGVSNRGRRTIASTPRHMAIIVAEHSGAVAATGTKLRFIPFSTCRSDVSGKRNKVVELEICRLRQSCKDVSCATPTTPKF